MAERTDVRNMTPHVHYLEAMLLKRGKHARKGENTAAIQSTVCLAKNTLSFTRPVKRAAWNVCKAARSLYKKFRSQRVCVTQPVWHDALGPPHNFCGSKARDQQK